VRAFRADRAHSVPRALERANEVRIARAKLKQQLATGEIAHSKTLGGLTDRQRGELIGLFRR
jgi:hypothetical protein